MAELIEEGMDRLPGLQERSPLPKQPDRELADKIVEGAYREVIASPAAR